VKVELDNPGERLKSGMFVRVRIHVQSSDDALVVPSAALVDLKERQVVYVVGEGDRAHVREVEVGIESGEAVEIVSGELSADDRVIVEGNFGLKDGAKVLVAE
jgi:membrane fusion protein (multidrug efflux system)